MAGLETPTGRRFLFQKAASSRARALRITISRLTLFAVTDSVAIRRGFGMSILFDHGGEHDA